MTSRASAAETDSLRSRGVFRFRDARIRSKLGLLLIIPLIAVVVLAAFRLVDSGQNALSVDLVRSLAVVSAQSSEVSHELHRERMAAARLLTEPDSDLGGFDEQAARTDAAIEEFAQARGELGTLPTIIEDRLRQIDRQLEGVPEIRQDVLRDGAVTLSAAVLRYGVILDDIIEYRDALPQVADDIELAESIRAVAALSKAKRHMSEAQAAAFVALADSAPDEGDLTGFQAARTGQQEALLAFSLAANGDQLAVVNANLTGDAMAAAERAAVEVTRSASGEGALDLATADRVFGAIANQVNRTESQLHDGQVALATELRDEVFRRVLLESVAVLLVLAFAIIVAFVLARTLTRSLGQLRENALAVAERDLPETVARLSDPRTLGENTPAELAAQVREPIQLRSRDEIGQVAQAFNVVHRAAVRVAAEQAALRTSVSAMFLNLARRSQSLVDRMISQLDEIERNEEDPKRLARMFTLDHLATRMRRNDENLLTLAGADSSPPRADDALVVDVLRAAQSEVEHYDRIEFGTVDSDVSVIASGVNDVVRLIAELFDNATRFSPPESPVVCEARRLGDQVIIQVEDRGVGMSTEQVERVNAWLASPPAVEVTTFRKMGLAVVARLANRQGIRVELRCDPNFGTVAYVALPRSVLLLPPSRLRYTEVAPPRSPMPAAELSAGPAGPPESAPSAPAAPAAPPLPARHVGALPRRSPSVVHHAANKRGQNSRDDYAGAETNNVDLPVAGRSAYDSGSNQHSTGAGTDHTGSGFAANDYASNDHAGNDYAGSDYASNDYASNDYAGSNHTNTDYAAGAGYAGNDYAGNNYPTGEYAGADYTGNRRTGSDGAGTNSTPLASAPVSAPTASGAPPAPEATVELPIFKEMEAVWFRSHGSVDLGDNPDAPRAGGYPVPPSMEQTQAQPHLGAHYGQQPQTGTAPTSAAPTSGSGAATGSPSAPPASESATSAMSDPQTYGGHGDPTGTEEWRTAADTGWQAAAAAAAPKAGGATKSGLPKRVPQAQLVPGSVETPTSSPNQRRSPEEVRGLLAAYHRGVQRGRESGGGR